MLGIITYGENNKRTKSKTTTLIVGYKKTDFPPGNNLIKMDNTQKNTSVILRCSINKDQNIE